MATTSGGRRKPASPRPAAGRAVPPASSPAPEPVATMPAVDAAPVAAAKPAESPATIVFEDTTMNETIKNVAEKAKATTEAAVARFGAQGKESYEKGRQNLEDFADFQKGNVEALAESARIAAKGFESLGQDAAAFAKKSFDQGSETLKAMAQVKSPTELLKLQADYFRTAFDALVAEASRSTEASLKLAGDVAQPLQNRLALAAEKVKVAA